ncbi:MAG: hypothetical protein GY798_06060 [Hyphomicrobiales bacterium]|nr:hypothetical protein [Hyphomicrobiales bacterium]
MRLLNDILVFVHVIGLFLGTAPGLATAVVSRQLVNATPEAAAALRQLPPIFVNISALGLLILWASGIVLVFTRWGGVEHLTVTFWVRAAFIVVLTIVAIMIHMTIREAKKTGDVAITQRLQPFVIVAALAALAAIFVTILTFHPA